MAIYEYRCEKCEATFSLSERISDHDESGKPPKCPECGSVKTHRLYSSFFAKTTSKT